MSNQPWRDKSTLHELYVEDGLSMADTADKLDVHPSTIERWLNKHSIESRSISEANSNGDVDKLFDEEYCRREYHEKGKSTYDIADQLKISESTVHLWLKKHGIETRKAYKDKPNADIDKLRDKEWLEQHYFSKSLTLLEIGEIIGCSDDNVKYWLEKHGLETRDRSYPRGENHHRYKADSPVRDDYYGPNWIRQRQRRIIKDQARCQRCGMAESQHQRKYDRSFDVHHIVNKREFVDSDGIFDYEAANDVENLITLCMACHRQVERWGVKIDRR